MKRLLLFLSIIYSSVCDAQDVTIGWYILERGCTVAIIKPGVNDLTYHLAASNNKPLDKTALGEMEKRINFSPGYVVLIHAIQNGYYIATDMEGRNLVIKGGATKVESGEGSGVAYLKKNFMTPGGAALQAGSYVWIKEHKTDQANALIQTAGKQTFEIPFDQLYHMNSTMVDMSKNVKFKTVL